MRARQTATVWRRKETRARSFQTKRARPRRVASRARRSSELSFGRFSVDARVFVARPSPRRRSRIASASTPSSAARVSATSASMAGVAWSDPRTTRAPANAPVGERTPLSAAPCFFLFSFSFSFSFSSWSSLPHRTPRFRIRLRRRCRVLLRRARGRARASRPNARERRSAGALPVRARRRRATPAPRGWLSS